MPRVSEPPRSPSRVEASVAAVSLGVLAFASPLRRLWAQPSLGPAAPFVVWIVVVVAAALLFRAAGRTPE